MSERPREFYEYMRDRMAEGRDPIEAMMDALLFGPTKDEGPSGATSGPLGSGSLSKDGREPVQDHEGPSQKTP